MTTKNIPLLGADGNIYKLATTVQSDGSLSLNSTTVAVSGGAVGAEVIPTIAGTISSGGGVTATFSPAITSMLIQNNTPLTLYYGYGSIAASTGGKYISAGQSQSIQVPAGTTTVNLLQASGSATINANPTNNIVIFGNQ